MVGGCFVSKVLFIRDGWGHLSGDVVDVPQERAALLEQGGYVVKTMEPRRVERAVFLEVDKRKANVER